MVVFPEFDKVDVKIDTDGNASTIGNLTIPFAQVVPNQLGLNETDLQPQPDSTIGNTTTLLAEAQGQPWPMALSIEYANR